MTLEQEIKSRFRNEYHKALININVTSSYLNDKIVAVMKSHEISSPQYNILRILRGQKSRQLCIGAIKERMIDKNSDVSRIVDRLLAKNLVERTESAKDRRQKLVKITQDGLDLLQKMDPDEQKLEGLLLNLSDSEVQILNELLDRIRSKQDDNNNT